VNLDDFFVVVCTGFSRKFSFITSGVPSTWKRIDHNNVKALWISVQKWTVYISSVSNDISF